MKALFVYENISFERGKNPKEAMDIGLPKEFNTPDEAADWAVRNLELITGGNYSPNSVIRSKEYEKIPKDLADYITSWAKTIKIGGKRDLEKWMADYSYFLQAFYELLRFHGILLRESVSFERGKGPKRAMGLGMVTIELDFHAFSVDKDENGNLVPDLDDPDTVGALETMEEIGADWRILSACTQYVLSAETFGVEIEFTGTYDQIASVLSELYIGSDNKEGIKKALMNWDGKDYDKLWNELDKFL